MTLCPECGWALVDGRCVMQHIEHPPPHALQPVTDYDAGDEDPRTHKEPAD